MKECRVTHNDTFERTAGLRIRFAAAGLSERHVSATLLSR
jgi:hypothetical protein